MDNRSIGIYPVWLLVEYGNMSRSQGSLFILASLILMIIAPTIGLARAQEAAAQIFLFYSQTCPHCEKALVVCTGRMYLPLPSSSCLYQNCGAELPSTCCCSPAPNGAYLWRLAGHHPTIVEKSGHAPKGYHQVAQRRAAPRPGILAGQYGMRCKTQNRARRGV